MVKVGLSRYPKVRRVLSIQFQTEPTKTEKLNALALKGLDEIAKDGPNEEYFTKAVKNLAKEHAESLRKNGYWLSQLGNYYLHNLDFVTDYDTVLRSIKPEDVKAFVQSLYSSKDRIVVTFRSTDPEAKK